MLKALPIEKKIDAQIQILQIFKMLNYPSTLATNAQPGPSGTQFTPGLPYAQHCSVPAVVRNVSQNFRSVPGPSQYISSPITVPIPTTSPNIAHYHASSHTQSLNSPSDSNDTIQSYISNYTVSSDESQIYDLGSQNNL